MSLFGTSPPDETVNPSMHSSFARSRHGLFDDEGGISRTNSDHLFDAEDETPEGGDDNNDSTNNDGGSPWDMPSPRKKRTRAELLRSLLPASDVPDAYHGAFEAAVRDEHIKNSVSSGGVARVLAASKLDADSQASIMNVMAPGGSNTTDDDGHATITLGRNEFNVLLALIGLAQEGEVISLDSVDERRRSESVPSVVSNDHHLRLSFNFLLFLPSNNVVLSLLFLFLCCLISCTWLPYPLLIALDCAVASCCCGGESSADMRDLVGLRCTWNLAH